MPGLFEGLDTSGLVVENVVSNRPVGGTGGNSETVGDPGLRSLFGRGDSNPRGSRGGRGMRGGRGRGADLQHGGGRGVTRPRQDSQGENSSPKRRGSLVSDSQSSSSSKEQAADGTEGSVDEQQQSGDYQQQGQVLVQPTPIFGRMGVSRQQLVEEE